MSSFTLEKDKDSTQQNHSSAARTRSRTGQAESGPTGRSEAVIDLHRTVGNQAVQRSVSDGFRGDVPVGAPDTESERQAERTADTVMRHPAPAADRRGEPPSTEADDATGSRSRDRMFTGSAGRPLSPDVRSFFEPRFGHSFRDVRVHTGPAADEAAQTLGARAFTIGQDIGFKSGEYSTDTQEGKRLLAHELTHVVQQRAQGGRPEVQRQAGAAATAAAWATVGSAGYTVAHGALTQSGDVSYSFDELEGTVLYNNDDSYKTQHKYPIQNGSKQIAVWMGTENQRKMGIKFEVNYLHDGFSIGSISMRLLDVYDWPMWGGSVRVNLTPEPRQPAAVRITVNASGGNTVSSMGRSEIFKLSADDTMIQTTAGPLWQEYGE